MVWVATALSVTAMAAISLDRILRPGAFPIEQVYLEGEFRHQDPELLRRTIVSAMHGNFFSLDLDRIERAAEELSWVHRATVRRMWPRGVRVRITEQQPVARWGDDAWLNTEAEVIRLSENAPAAGLPQLAGPDDYAQVVWTNYRRWLAPLRTMGLDLVELAVNSRFAWTLSLRPAGGGDDAAVFLLLLGSEEIDLRMSRFLKSYNSLSRPDGNGLLRVDMRYPNGVAVTRRAEPAADGDTA